ncbi:MAG: VOC family protein [Anaerolineae bacterium]|nr:VOC family protein [Anaerolineae bacterium]
MTEHLLPDSARLGLAHLRVTGLDDALAFYSDGLGLLPVRRDGNTVWLAPALDAAPIVALTGDSHFRRKARASTGLYHIAIRTPGRPALANLLRRLAVRGVPFSGFSDHAVSEALYLPDPDGNGIELYRDRPRTEWRIDDGRIEMTTEPLDAQALLDEAEGGDNAPLDPQTDLGHVHLHVGNLAAAEAFWSGVIGFDVVLRGYPGALFVSAGGYHHHLGLNTWAGSAHPPADSAGLAYFTLLLPDETDRTALLARAAAAGVIVEDHEGRPLLRDKDGNAVVIELDS